MTPKEKAEELVEKMSFDFDMCRGQNIKCALIAVDEILQDGMLETAPFMRNGKDLMNSNYIRYKEFWQQVKNEIEKL